MRSADTSCANNSVRSCATKRYIHRFTPSSCEAFGRWCSTHEWFTDIQEPVSATNLTVSFTTELHDHSAIDQFIPTKLIKIHDTDKPWMSPILKQLIIKRQKAFHSGDETLWRHYRNKVQYETPFTRYGYETLPVKNHYVFNYSHGTGRVILVTTFVHFIIEIRTLKCFA